MSTILIIEDEETVRKFLAINLKARGYDVMEAANGREGLELMRTVDPSLVLMDIRMPDLNGWEVLNELGDNTPPIFVMTAYVLDAKACQEEYPAITKLLFKPITARQLITAVRDVIG
jgi:CheY-like chemotaxis protein